jgi:hypothetical protein
MDTAGSSETMVPFTELHSVTSYTTVIMENFLASYMIINFSERTLLYGDSYYSPFDIYRQTKE